MGNAPPHHQHTLRGASLDASVTTTPIRRRAQPNQRRSTPASAPTTTSDASTASPSEHPTGNEQRWNSSATADPPSLSPPLPASHSDDDIVHTLAPKYDPTAASERHPLLAALDALPLTEPLSTALDPPSIDHHSADSAYRIQPIQRIDARAVDELLRLCRQYVKDDVAQLLADQRDIAGQLDAVEEGFGGMAVKLRSMNDDVRLLLHQMDDCQLPLNCARHTADSAATAAGLSKLSLLS